MRNERLTATSLTANRQRIAVISTREQATSDVFVSEVQAFATSNQSDENDTTMDTFRVKLDLACILNRKLQPYLITVEESTRNLEQLF